MLQALLTSALSGLKADMAAQAQRVAVMIGLSLVALLIFFVGLGAFATAAALALEPFIGLPAAAAAVGAAALLLAAMLVFIGTYRKPAPSRSSQTVDEASRAIGEASAAAQKSMAEFSDIAKGAPLPILLSALALGVLFGSKPKRRRK